MGDLSFKQGLNLLFKTLKLIGIALWLNDVCFEL